MGLHERMKISKVVEEIYGYFLELGCKKISVSLEIKEEETTFTIKLNNPKKNIEKLFKDNLYCCRDVELEEYAWELVGDTECSCSLQELGMLIDKYDIVTYENETIITLYRKNK